MQRNVQMADPAAQPEGHSISGIYWACEKDLQRWRQVFVAINLSSGVAVVNLGDRVSAKRRMISCAKIRFVAYVRIVMVLGASGHLVISFLC